MARKSANRRKPSSTKPKQPPVDQAHDDIAKNQMIDAIPPELHQSQTSEILVKVADPDPSEHAAPEPETVPMEEPQPVPVVPPKRGGFFPLVLGGLAAGGIGFAVATFLYHRDNPLVDIVSEQAIQIANLQEQMATSSDMSDMQSEIEMQFGSIDSRLTELENLPIGAGPISDRAVAAFEAELDTLRDQMQTMTDSATVRLDDARAEAGAIEENAVAAARGVAARAALSRLKIALENNASLAPALTDLQDATDKSVPDALLAVQGGAPSLAGLQADFADAARAALTAARQDGVSGEETTGFGAFLRNQFDVRSVEPRDGDDADAVLSRAGAFVADGHLTDALTEIAALPDVARAEMSGWLSQAQARVDAIAAVDTLSNSFNTN